MVQDEIIVNYGILYEFDIINRFNIRNTEKIFHFNIKQVVNIENIFNERNYTFLYSTSLCIHHIP